MCRGEEKICLSTLGDEAIGSIIYSNEFLQIDTLKNFVNKKYFDTVLLILI